MNCNEEGHADGGVHCRGDAHRRCGCGGRGFVDATQDDMKMPVCAQCHVEYYFAEPGNVLTFPRAQGTTPAADVMATQMPTWQDCANRPRPSPGRARADLERMCRRVQFRWD